MFGKNKITKESDFLSVKEDELKVTSIFYTIQGEGPLSGLPAVFVRLTGCNLCCNFCDAFFDNGELYSFNQILEKMNQMIVSFYTERNISIPANVLSNKLCVITGGEPTLQKNLTAFLAFLHQNGYRTQIESNGILFRDIPEETLLVISPKANETTGKYLKINDKMLKRANALKFVISATKTGYTDIPDFAKQWYEDKNNYGMLFFSPMNMYDTLPIKTTDTDNIMKRSEVDERISFWTKGLLNYEENQKNHEYTAELALKYGGRLSLQQHLYANLP